MNTIEIDNEVYEFLRMSARPFEEPTPNHVLRRLLLKNEGGTMDHPVRERHGKPRPTGSSAQFMADFLRHRYGSGFKTKSPYRTMFESPSHLVYFQNFNKAGSPNLWYRLKATALGVLRTTTKESFVCLTNPAERLAYVLPVAEIFRRAKNAGWQPEQDLEVNVDHVNSRWRELDWRIESNLVRLDGTD